MMKKVMLLASTCLVLAFNSALFGQASSYSFVASSATYVPLTGTATNVPAVEADDATALVEIGFNFDFEGVTYDSVMASSNGFLSFVLGSSSSASNNLSAGGGVNPLVAPLWDDLAGGASSSSANYEVSGTSPNRIFTFEWRDWEWSFNSTDSVISFQVQLIETSNEVKFAYRWESDSSRTSPDASIGLSGLSSFLSVTGTNTATPTVSNTTEDIAIDSIVNNQVFTFTPPACPAPSGLAATNITTSSIDLSWTGSGTGPWYVWWGPCGFDQASSSQDRDTVTTSMLSLTGLMSGTAYEFRVFEECGLGVYSDTISMGCVSTQCLVQTLPYAEDFNFSTGCFSIADSGATTDTWMRISDYSGDDIDGTDFMFVDSDGAGSVSMIEYLTSGAVDASTLTGTLFLEFDQFFEQFVSSTANVQVWDGSQWVTVLTQNGTSVGSWTTPNHQMIDITLYANANLQVRFVYTGTYEYYWAIDNFLIHEVNCAASSNVMSFASSSDSISINWTPGSGVKWGVEYGTTGFLPGTGTDVTRVDTFLTANSLSPNTAYDFYITDTCVSGNSSVQGPFTFWTPCIKQTIPYTNNFAALNCFQVVNGGNTGDTWMLEPDGTTGNSAGGDLDGTSLMIVNSDAGSSAITLSEELLSPIFDASTISGSLILEFDHYLRRLTSDSAYVEVYDGIQWVKVRSYKVTTGAFSAAAHELIDVTAYANADFQVRFYYSDNGGWNYYWLIDNFSLSILTCGLSSAITLDTVSPSTADISWTSNASLWNIEWGPQGFTQGSGIGNMIKGAATNPYMFTGLSADSCYDFYVQDTCPGVGTGQWDGPFTFCTLPSCPPPTALGALNFTINSTDVFWTDGGFANNYNVEYGTAGFTKGGGTMLNTTNDTVTISSLMAGTEYEFYVRDSCGAGDVSVWSGPFAFYTAFTTNYLNDFALTGVPEAWQEAEGRLGANAVLTSLGSSSWLNDDFGNNVASPNGRAQRINVFVADYTDWLITPSIYLDPTITNLQVEFDAAITAYASTNQGYLGSDDTLAVVISLDNGLTWDENNILWYADNSDTVDAVGEHHIIPLTGISGYVKFGLYAGSRIDDIEDNDLFIDNFEVRTPRACANPTALMVNQIKTDSARVYWTEGTSGFINGEVFITAPGQPAAAGTVVNSINDTLILSGLTNSTSYCVYVVEECANGFTDTLGPVCFSTLCLPQGLPYFEDFTASLGCFNAQIGGTTPDTWHQTTSYNTNTLNGTPFAFVDSDGAGSGATLDEVMTSVQIDASSITGPLILEFDHYFNNLSTDSGFVDVYDGTSWVNVMKIGSDVGGWLAPQQDSLDITMYANANLQVRFHYNDNGVYAWYWAVDNVSIKELTSCMAPSNVLVSSLNCDSATITWSSDTVIAASYIEYGPVGFTQGAGTVVSGVSSPVVIAGLMLNTNYEVYVSDSCNTIGYSTTGPISFKTDSLAPVWATFNSAQNNTTLIDATVDFDATNSTGDGISYAWDFGNGATGVGSMPSGTYTSNGTYNVMLTVTDKCGNTDDTTITITVGGISVVEQSFDASLELYPNPSEGVFNVTLNNATANYTLQISDVSGRVVFTRENCQPGQSQSVNISHVSKGIYMVHLKGDGISATRRISIN